MTTGPLPAIASSLALWPGLFLVAGGLAKAVDVSRGDVGGTVLARLVDGRAPLRAAWALVAAAELAVGVLVVAGLAVPWPEAAAALLLSGAALVAVWGIRHAPDAGCGCFGAALDGDGRPADGRCAPACSRSWRRWPRSGERAGRASSTIRPPSPASSWSASRSRG